MDAFALDQFGKNVRGAFEGQARPVEAENSKELSADFETKSVIPLQFFCRLGKTEAIFLKRVDIHERLSESECKSCQSKFGGDRNATSNSWQFRLKDYSYRLRGLGHRRFRLAVCVGRAR